MINCSEPDNSFEKRMILINDNIHVKLDNDVRPKKKPTALTFIKFDSASMISRCWFEVGQCHASTLNALMGFGMRGLSGLIRGAEGKEI